MKTLLLISCAVIAVYSQETEITCDCKPEEYPRAVCGTDGNVYSSSCALKKASCKSGTDIKPQEWDKCLDKQSLCPDKCLDLYDPVCGDDGVIYTNTCIMQRKNCGRKMRAQNLVTCLTKYRSSRKVEPCPEECVPVYEPVCDTTGEIHYNECFYRQAVCGQEDLVKLQPLKKCIIDGNACPEKCLPIMDPVCGSDGRRYLNHCKFHEQNCGKGTKKMPWAYCLSKPEADEEIVS